MGFSGQQSAIIGNYITDAANNQDEIALRQLSKKFSGEYMTIGLHLDFSYNSLQQIETDHQRDCVARNNAMLMQFWNRKRDRQDKVFKLKQAFSKAERNDVSGDLDDMFQQPS